ncbi:hypothetical protein ACFOON_16520 [Novosphingobium piscinae]|uniref:Uncharacterized protein n=1 Tax=Novosphingobium piscinae TaxID=1507448 RepID=A0A7X1FYM5_9SPHN|nr:hypothetical protein [Novosphingobium piscinae]MBC2669395.1 hypothetical protein [Novosphingobium piscinae]
MSDKTKGNREGGRSGDSRAADNPAADSAAEPAPPEGVRALALDYPFALIAGGIVAGVVIGSLLPRSGRLSKTVGALAAVAGEVGLSYARKAIDGVGEAAGTAAEAGGKVASVVGERAGDLIEAAGDKAGTYGGKAAETAEQAVASLRHSAEGLARQVIRLTSQLRH